MKKCDACGEEKENVRFVNDPYAEDVHGEILKLNLCNDCYEMSCDDI